MQSQRGPSAQPVRSQQTSSQHQQVPVHQTQTKQPSSRPGRVLPNLQQDQSNAQSIHSSNPQDSASRTNRANGNRVEPRVVSGDRIPSPRVHIQDGSNGYRQLKVEDALAYLEQVKSQFSRVPRVYNDFLDIMKEFKAQTIDTAEVIRRVSTLFEGHRDLILGFNTFLPPGYKIELREDPTTGCVTGFSGPGGNFCALNHDTSMPHVNSVPDSSNSNTKGNVMNEQSISVNQVPRRGVVSANRTRRTSNSAANTDHIDSERDQEPALRDIDEKKHELQRAASEETNAVEPKSEIPLREGVVPHPTSNQKTSVAQRSENPAAALAGGLVSPMLGPSTGVTKHVEFDQAVNYVNRIKGRFEDNDTVYKTFLSILQTYQKEQRTIKEVYDQVSHLFRDHIDLLREFTHFLPETAPHAAAAQHPMTVGPVAATAGNVAAPTQMRAPALTVKKQIKLEPPLQEFATSDGAAAAGAAAGTSTGTGWKGKDKGGKTASIGKAGTKTTEPSSGPGSGIVKPSSAPPKTRNPLLERKGRRIAPPPKKSAGDLQSDVQALDSHVGQGQTVPLGFSADGEHVHRLSMENARRAGLELVFFDELKNALGKEGEQNYAEFIKCLSLFSQEIIGNDELLKLTEGLFLNRKSISDAFRAFLDQSDPNPTETAIAIFRGIKSGSYPRSDAKAAGNISAPQLEISTETEDVTKGHGLKVAPHPNSMVLPNAELRTDRNAVGSADVTMKAVDTEGPDNIEKTNPIYKNKPLSEIGREFGSDLPGSSSYSVLPSDVGQIPSSGMSAADRSVLNHFVVSKGGGTLKDGSKGNGGRRSSTSSKKAPNVGTGISTSPRISDPAAGDSNTCSPRAVLKNGSGKNCTYGLEDQRVEVDLLISRAESTVAKLEKVARSEIKSISTLSPMDLKPVEMIYHDASIDMLELLRTNTGVALPIVMSRLKERIADWHASRKKLEQVWKSRRFGSARKGNGRIPRSWKRLEMKNDLLYPEDGGSSSSKAGGDELVKERGVSTKAELICEDENMNFIIETIWFSFEWASDFAEDKQAADAGVDFLERVFKMLQRSVKRATSVYICEYLFEYIRLIGEASVRIKFIVDNDRDGGKLTSSMLDLVKDVLSGTIGLSAYDDKCEKIVGKFKGWEDKMCDLTVVLKRLCEAATTLHDHESVMELMEVAEKCVSGQRSLAKDKWLRKALSIGESREVDIFLVSSSILWERKSRDEVGASTSKDVVKERSVGLTFEYVPKHSAEQYEELDLENVQMPDRTEGDDKNLSTTFLRRCKKRKWDSVVEGSKSGGVSNDDADSNRKKYIKVDGLNARVNHKTGELMYVHGTEDFFMRDGFLMRGKRGLGKLRNATS